MEYGWGLDITSKGVNHYYDIDGRSKCGKKIRLFHITHLIKDTKWTPILGYNCVKCTKLLKII